MTDEKSLKSLQHHLVPHCVLPSSAGLLHRRAHHDPGGSTALPAGQLERVGGGAGSPGV